MKLYDKIQKSNIDLRPLGLDSCSSEITYYCTPEHAKILGWAGVDGIHYCTIPKFGEMIFAVSPMNFGDCVHLIARNFEDLLRLLLSCTDMGALEQCYAWNEEQFKAFLTDYPATSEQQEVLARIQREYGLVPMEDAFGYVKKLQAEFDLSQIPYTDDYYDPDMNAAAPERSEPWEVYFDSSDRPGTEIALDSCFTWNDEIWHIPAVYLFSKGIVVDFCVEIDPEREKAFIEKWEPSRIEEERLTQELQNQIDRENPLNIEFRPYLTVNGKQLTNKCGMATSWIPASCLPSDVQNDRKAGRVIKHYGLDETRAWSFHRNAFLWKTNRKPAMKSMSLKLEREAVQIDGLHFRNLSVGDVLTFIHPVFGTEHKLTVLEYEQQELTPQAFADSKYEFPTHYTAMTYALEPEIPNKNFQVTDCLDSDRPRRRIENDYEPEAAIGACAVSIIGGTDGPTAIILSDRNTKTTSYTALSSLHFEPQNDVEWKMIFSEKLIEDMEVKDVYF